MLCALSFASRLVRVLGTHMGRPSLPRAPYYPQLAAASCKSLSIRAEQGPSPWQAEEGTVRCFETQSERLCALSDRILGDGAATSLVKR